MGRRKKPHNKRKGGSRPKRGRAIKKVFHLICEGANTEPHYFEGFKKDVNNIKIETEGTGQQHLKIVQTAIDYRDEKIAEEDRDTEEVWVVFDFDIQENKKGRTKQDFNNAIAKAEQNDIKHATSNDCFELWYVLHFELLKRAEHRDWYCSHLSKLLKKHFGYSYSKKGDISKKMYDLLIDRQETAINNAKKLEKEQKGKNPSDKNPYTGVYILVEELNKYRRK